ncbi:MAG: WecB/TagA/CpsF family glycosyltransferase [Planctomycetota bacterium]
MKKHVEICNIRFPLLDYEKAISVFERWIEGGRPHQVCVANVHTVTMCERDKEFWNITKCADMITMDGHPLRWYANLIHGTSIKDRITGSGLMVKSIENGVKKGWCHFFLGSTEEVLRDLEDRISDKYNGVRIVGMHSPPFRQLTKEEDEALVNMINNAKPDFLWVALGAPKQEKWIYEHLDRIHVPIQIGVGAAFDFHAGRIKRAPEFMQRLGLEWLYRVYRDPRLWKRYLTTNPVFMYIFVRDFIKVRLLRRKLEQH